MRRLAELSARYEVYLIYYDKSTNSDAIRARQPLPKQQRRRGGSLSEDEGSKGQPAEGRLVQVECVLCVRYSTLMPQIQYLNAPEHQY